MIEFTYKNGCIIAGNIKDQNLKDVLAYEIEKFLEELKK